ncbi:MAG: CBS domain-containing protein [Gammaproteobacteria bacterium]|uniref:putative nucleotidyltransferase substrate binding domain-containing protein n=1 Tax=Rhodoferax sp. TaxID=50421 RepID=UPI0018072D71|nr:putative nucleotidyltransferase substrate binding domain-containing protein [Rhodoferax sp.]MBU3899319.1 CBS domain-containing protein [Gammaproteobacteria bacterium]MBA3057001.1 cyclic nucleotide-binding/CBS domain-containing protein [Rhodoferax sp.]MBU3996879.1 CBS domain-containing protein [Gammaproteobacteria bacterium]MBU4081295.1 CBS domain-containing protein [Gammaproteobacteria bacterium]MBU4114300.1 CBS domain-containing protein [Gammaproteobacteria bacterium]
MPIEATAPPSLVNTLAKHRVWGQLDLASRKALAAQFTQEVALAGATLLGQGQLHRRLGLILSGEVDLRDPDLGLSVRLRTGELFGLGATPTQQLATWQAVAASPCQIAWLAPQTLLAQCQSHPALAYFLPSIALPLSQDEVVSHASEAGAALNLLGTPIRALIKREPITLAPATSIRAAAQLMSDLRVSSVMLVEQGLLFGVVTDRDLRNRLVAQGLDSERPVADIATLAPLTVDANSPAFEALLLMARHNIHHVPVMDGQRIVGMITATDLTEQHSTSAVYLAGDIYKQGSLEGLSRVSRKVKLLQQNLAAADASAYSTGHIVTAITDALTVRLIQLAEAQLGPAPIDYVWVAAGSQARSEQTAKSDQDNCLILDDNFDETAHGAYFRAFSKFVCDGLAACGYIHCPGEMMAMTDTWRQPRRVWAEYFRTWVEQPKPKALMLTCVFFDLRAIHGKTELLNGLRYEVLARTKGNSLFLAHMVGNALKHRPPLGLFGTISLIRGGENARTIDLKHSGIVPIVDLARVYALAGGIAAVNTHDRLEAVGQAGEVSEQGARDLRDALEFLAKLRIAHQARQIQQNQAPDNFLALEELSNFERSHLKEAFSVVQTLQGVLQQRY